MAAYGVGPASVSSITPTSRCSIIKVGVCEVADGAVGFAAFGLPKGAFIGGIYTISKGANATQTLNVGFTNGGTELLNAFAPNSTGYAPAGAATGSAVGTVLTEEKTVFIKASLTLTNPVYVKVEYWMPPQGLAF